MATYAVFDGRAMYDIDEAAMYEYLGELPSDLHAMETAKQAWVGLDAALVDISKDVFVVVGMV